MVEVADELDTAGADDLVELARALVGGQPPSRLLLDTSGVTFIDAAGLGALVRLAALADERGASFHLPDPSARVRRLLSVVGLSYAC